jgi:hypothetical protein
MSQIYVNLENTYVNVREYEVKIFHNSEFILNYVLLCFVLTIIISYHTIISYTYYVYVSNQMNSVHLLTLDTVPILCITLNL